MSICPRHPLSRPKTPSERPTVVRAPHQIHSTCWHQLAVSPTQVTPAQGTSPMYANEQNPGAGAREAR